MNEIIHVPEGIPLDGPFWIGSLRAVHTRRGQFISFLLAMAVLLLNVIEAFVLLQFKGTAA